MKRLITLCFIALVVCAAGQAQQTTPMPIAAATPATSVRIGYLSTDSLLRAMPGYAAAMDTLARMESQYAAETEYNEQNFKRMFADFLQGQKNFPQPILLKRQQDLQVEMERSMAFRRSCDSLMHVAREALLQPLRARLEAAIRAVGLERDYDMILNTDAGAVPFLRPAAVEHAAPYVMAKLTH